MEQHLIVLTALLLAACAHALTFKDVAKGKFLIGVAVGADQVDGRNPQEAKIIAENFNSLTAENCMKAAYLHPAESVFHFEEADRLVNFGTSHGMFVVGHCLLWHECFPRWMRFVSGTTNDVNRDIMEARMKNHIQTIVSHFKGRVKGWDVVNEGLLDNGEYRKESPYLQIIGPEYIELAFKWAHEADPDAELYYSDYGTESPAKCAAICKLVGSLKQKGCRVDAICMQGHMSMEYPTVEALEKSIQEYAKTGCKVNITEWDISVLPSCWGRQGRLNKLGKDSDEFKKYNPYSSSLPPEQETAWDKRVCDIFRVFLRQAASMGRVTTWGLQDSRSWLNHFPVRGRTDYPLFWDRSLNRKPVVEQLKEL